MEQDASQVSLGGAARSSRRFVGVRTAKKGAPPIIPAVLTPSGPVDLSTLMLRNRIIFVGSPVNSEVCVHELALVFSFPC